MGQAASIDSYPGGPRRSRANTLKSHSPPLKYAAPRLSLPEYALTQYDVKQLMKSYNSAIEKADTRTTSSAESEAEDELMEQIHGQFGPHTRPRSALRSTTSNASEDSGIDDLAHSPRHSLDDLSSLPVFTRTFGEDTPLARTPATPVVVPHIFNMPLPSVELSELPPKEDAIPQIHEIAPVKETGLSEFVVPQPKRRFIPKRLFGRKKIRNSGQRQRSKSLGATETVIGAGGL
ncbi:unnamed protein product [Heligmosomoides polygyrus]|uniref:Uncharacterized protein n=1 Tax=Heligmosomoides polygyrus TaxID=6339 RepID=A0A183G479_HELPZ|nr:unnamed protein product [Heligmosomoides polygyrus]